MGLGPVVRLGGARGARSRLVLELGRDAGWGKEPGPGRRRGRGRGTRPGLVPVLALPLALLLAVALALPLALPLALSLAPLRLRTQPSR